MPDTRDMIPQIVAKCHVRLGRCWTSDIADELERQGRRLTKKELAVVLNQLHERGRLACGVWGMGDPRSGGYTVPYRRSKLRAGAAPSGNHNE